jgi:hypothetical protein
MTILLLLASLFASPMAPPPQSPAAPPDSAATVEAAVMHVLDDYMTAFNRMDMAAWESTFQFPHYRLASAQMKVLDHAGLQNAEDVRKSLGAGWHHSAWGRRKIIQWSPDKAHVDTLFVRYRADGSVMGSFESLYVLTKEQGRWGVKLRSSFAP